MGYLRFDRSVQAAISKVGQHMLAFFIFIQVIFFSRYCIIYLPTGEDIKSFEVHAGDDSEGKMWCI
jgi:hypothetical protein